MATMLPVSAIILFLGLMLLVRGAMKYGVSRGVGHGMSIATGDKSHADPGPSAQVARWFMIIGAVMTLTGGIGAAVVLLG